MNQAANAASSHSMTLRSCRPQNMRAMSSAPLPTFCGSGASAAAVGYIYVDITAVWPAVVAHRASWTT